ncbi:MAG: hypothetical protein J0L70_06275 [Leptolyngbya sp. UWPOB_LEPTO1]|uniref:hypothetical protein n=1 Tax=Leptolyngbya sp. UWPOB_LEPTO1 TaxID=2815653 RepID=UPI001ACEEE77|nr:hypothetical protein [Leptolyngbya sp. UWPOB_LEPTO1]MBN8560110.1 hypothetical protein [Leptolyngbya sp. UWPOB_LEPTO1]
MLLHSTEVWCDGNGMVKQNLSVLTTISVLRQCPLEPSQYCERWVTIDPAQSYRKACVRALAQATKLSPGTIENWGPNFQRRPKAVLYLLRQVDLLNQFQRLHQTGVITVPYDSLHE